MSEMDASIKVIISGLDGAGKTSILTALNKKYDFQKEIMELKPTIKVEYHQMDFLGNTVYVWDMGGQEKYRKLYAGKQDVYFADTDLLVYVIDIQDEERFDESLNYLNLIINYFVENNYDVPLIIALHKYDPDLRGEELINNNIVKLRDKILVKYPTFKILFQQTSIFDIISIVQLISYGLSVFDEKFFELSELLELYLEEFGCISLIIFNQNGIIISEFYSDTITPDIYISLLDSIKEHLFLLKRMQEEDYESNYNFYTIENDLLSYLHRVKAPEDADSFFISVIIEAKQKDVLLEKFADFLIDLNKIMETLLL